MTRERRAFGMMMVDQGDADGIVSGINATYPDTIRPALQIIGLRAGVRRAAGMDMLLKGHDVLFCASGNIAYKLLTSFGGAEAVGRILLGMREPVTVLSQTSPVETIVHMAAITVATSSRTKQRREQGQRSPQHP
jgi:phosphotransacetylase